MIINLREHQTLIQFVHQVDVRKYDDNKYIDRSSLGEPKAQFEATDLNVVERIFKKIPAP